MKNELTGKSKRFTERLIELTLAMFGHLSVAVTFGIIVLLFVESLRFFSDVSLVEFLSDTSWTPLAVEKRYGIWPLVAGSMLITAVALVTAVPMGLLSAVYLSEYASERTRALLKPLLEVLAGVPTVVYGYFALAVVTPVLQSVIPGLGGFNALGPGLVIGMMVTPMVASLSEDALNAVPATLREASLGLGATKLTTIVRVVFPVAASGIGSAILLSFGRALGETMIVSIAAGQQPNLTLDPREAIQTMTGYIIQLSQGDIPLGSPEYRTMFAVAFALFLISFVGNWLSIKLLSKTRDFQR